MDTIGCITDYTLHISPSKKFKEYLCTINISDDIPISIIDIIKSDSSEYSDDKSKIYLTTKDIKWLLKYLESTNNEDQTVYLHELLEDSEIILPKNEVIKRSPELEKRCIKLRSQQMNRDYRAMTKNVDNVRVRQPEETIAYQIKHLNKQLVAIAQFVMSVAAGFLFGFLGVELMIGSLDFGFRLLLGVMCALIIALAEIYFLAKKLNEDLNIAETVQLGGPTVFSKKDD